MSDGWIKLYRALLDKPIWKLSTPHQRSVLIAIMLMANHEDNEWEWKGEPFKVKKGSFVTSLESIRKSAGKGTSIQNVRAAITRFKKLKFLTERATKSGRHITILNWEKYQPPKESTQQRNQQRGNKGATPNKNDKNERIYKHYRENINPAQKSKQRALRNINTHLKKYSFDDLVKSTENYQSTLNGTDPQFRKNPANFFGINEKYFIDYLPENFDPPKQPEPPPEFEEGYND